MAFEKLCTKYHLLVELVVGVVVAGGGGGGRGSCSDPGRLIGLKFILGTVREELGNEGTFKVHVYVALCTCNITFAESLFYPMELR